MTAVSSHSPLPRDPELVFGVWDGHDAGVAVVRNLPREQRAEVLYAANEERFTHRKLDVGFPHHSLREAVRLYGKPDLIVVPTIDPSKVLARAVPAAARSYYRFRRHLADPSFLNRWKLRFKLLTTQLPPLPGCRTLTAFLANWRAHIGPVPIATCDHHAAHLRAAYFTSEFPRATVLSLDGIGDAASGAVALGDGSSLSILTHLPGRDSIGLIYEHATRLLSMRELEDEGKVMALAMHADLDEKERTVLHDLITVERTAAGIRIRRDRHAFHRLEALLWKWGPERFAAAVQSFAEHAALEIVRAVLDWTKEPRLAVAGGVFANIRINRLLRETVGSPQTYDSPASPWIFPHMGDGGLALGAALTHPTVLHPFLGSPLDEEEIRRTAERARGENFRVKETSPREIARLLAEERVIGYAQGRMEFGPRALGARSILARPDNPAIRDRLNLVQKRRVFYQPFCPTLLLREARESLENYDGRAERWMTSLYGTIPQKRTRLGGVIGPDGSCRCQILPESPETPEETRYKEVVEAFAEETGIGALLNTSFNIHGDPIVRTAKDAYETFRKSRLDALVLQDILIERRERNSSSEKG